MSRDSQCCDTMRAQLEHHCELHADLFDCPDVLIVYNPVFDEYGIPIRDGGRSKASISFCPWCGSELPPSKRDLWFDTLASLGIADPGEQPVPPGFQSDQWWRSGE